MAGFRLPAGQRISSGGARPAGRVGEMGRLRAYRQSGKDEEIDKRLAALRLGVAVSPDEARRALRSARRAALNGGLSYDLVRHAALRRLAGEALRTAAAPPEAIRPS